MSLLDKSINSCHQLGCMGACCNNRKLALNLGELFVFSKGINPPPEQIYRLDVPQEEPGVFYYDFGSQTPSMENLPPIHLIINGPCPHLDLDFNCNIHQAPISACRQFPFNGLDCRKIRQKMMIR